MPFTLSNIYILATLALPMLRTDRPGVIAPLSRPRLPRLSVVPGGTRLLTPVAATHCLAPPPLSPIAGPRGIDPSVTASPCLKSLTPVTELTAMDAIGSYLRELHQHVGRLEMELSAIHADYTRYTIEFPHFAAVSEKRLSQCLVAHGCQRQKRDRRRKGQDGRRVTVFKLRQPRVLQ